MSICRTLQDFPAAIPKSSTASGYFPLPTKQIYQQVTGNVSNGFTILEISYSIGLAAGVLFFFNHFGRKKFSADPTPMQVQMRQYEDNVNTTLLEENSRKASSS